jgi:hypothetical protein
MVRLEGHARVAGGRASKDRARVEAAGYAVVLPSMVQAPGFDGLCARRWGRQTAAEAVRAVSPRAEASA